MRLKTETRLAALEQTAKPRGIQSLSDAELWALLPAWWRNAPDALIDELCGLLALREIDEAAAARYREFESRYGIAPTNSGHS